MVRTIAEMMETGITTDDLRDNWNACNQIDSQHSAWNGVVNGTVAIPDRVFPLYIVRRMQGENLYFEGFATSTGKTSWSHERHASIVSFDNVEECIQTVLRLRLLCVDDACHTKPESINATYADETVIRFTCDGLGFISTVLN